MDIRDLTGRHAVSFAGVEPKRYTSGGPDGRGYTDFNGTGCLTISDPLHDFVYGAGPFCFEIQAYVYPSSNLIAPGSSSRIVDTGAAYGLGWSLSGSNSTNSFYAGPPPFGLLAAGWHAFRWDIAAGACDVYVDGVLRSHWTTAYTNPSIWHDLMTVGSDVDGNYAITQIAGLRITRALRGSTSFDLSLAGDADPLWSQTVLHLSMAAAPRGSHDDLLRRLLPPVAIDRNGARILVETLAYGAALDLATASASALQIESDPRTTSSLLGDWERNYGLEAGIASDSVRRSALVAQILSGGGQSRAFYVSLAAAMGYTATVTESTPHTVMSEVTFPLYSGAWRHVWKIRAHANAGAVSNAAFEALINKLKPAHTRVIFEYY